MLSTGANTHLLLSFILVFLFLLFVFLLSEAAQGSKLEEDRKFPMDPRSTHNTSPHFNMPPVMQKPTLYIYPESIIYTEHLYILWVWTEFMLRYGFTILVYKSSFLKITSPLCSNPNPSHGLFISKRDLRGSEFKTEKWVFFHSFSVSLGFLKESTFLTQLASLLPWPHSKTLALCRKSWKESILLSLQMRKQRWGQEVFNL